jgi:hypothetical protein
MQESYVLTRWVFLRGLGAVYFCAFASLWPQVLGLIGSRGILPARGFLEAVAAQAGPERFRLVPTLAWLDPSDSALRGLCLAGMLLSLLLIVGVLPVPTLAGLWLLYLSLVSVGQDFLGFQWDTLLLETGFLAIWLAPLRVWPRFASETPPSRLALWLGRWLLFRLMFGSGVVKLASGDPTWRDGTAMAFHYETQPLPTPPAWFLHLLPLPFHHFSTLAVLVVELAAPFLIFAPRRGRLAGAVLLAGLQALILLTGNFAFFNYLTLALCVLLLDDSALRRLVPARLRHWLPAEPEARPAPMRARRLALAPVAAVLLAVSLGQIAGEFGLPSPLRSLVAWQEPLHLVNPYGLFAVMTTSHPVIAVEGSDDGRTWHEYGFRDQPQDVNQSPRFVAPFQPRLDWQLWFAALGSADNAPWFRAFLVRLLQGSPDVLGLLQTNPFPHAPPRFVRATLYDYRFTDARAKRLTGAWWQRRSLGLYFPPASLRPSP